MMAGCAPKEKVEMGLSNNMEKNDNNSETQGNDVKINSTEPPQKEKSEMDKKKQPSLSEAMKSRAKKEGVSEAEMEKIVKELVSITAKRYGITEKEYYESLEEGETAFEEFATAADFMGITIKEYYEYEKNKPELSEEDKKTIEGMKDAVSELEKMNLEGQAEVEENHKELGLYKIDEILLNSKAGNSLLIQYVSRADFHEIVKHYKDMLENTENAVVMENDESTQIIGTLKNGASVNVSIYPNDDGIRTNVDYSYTGDMPQKQ